jgi:aldose 1-epimerase
MTTLSCAGYGLEVLPELGGAIRTMTFAGIQVLRTVSPTVKDVGDTGCFPLIPFVNRIANGAFSFDGHAVHLPTTFAGHPHALHGHGWHTAWEVALETKSTLILSYEHRADAWPWPYMGEERFVLDETGLHVSLAVRNTGGTPMPVSLGLHPWFQRTPATTLKAQVDGVWLTDPTLLPTEMAAGSHFLDLGAGADLKSAPVVDNCHTGWTGPAVIDQPDLGLTVTLSASENCPFLHIYAPVGSDFVCAEPVSAMPDAVNRPEAAAVTGARAIGPGERFDMAMHIAAQKRRA